MLKRKHISESSAFKANKIHKVVEAPVSAVVSFTSFDATNSAYETEGFNSLLMNNVDNYSVRSVLSQVVPPASRLVGIELNPGPPKKGVKTVTTTTSVSKVKNKNKNKRNNDKVSSNTVQTNMPSAIGYTSTSRVPIQKSGKNGSYTVSNCELVNSQINGSTTFTVQQGYFLNPGLTVSFPWLSQQAQNWEQYRFTRLSYEYIPIAPTSKSGDIMLVPDYDPSDPVPQTEIEALNSQGAKTFPVWQHTVIDLDPRGLHALGPRKFLRDSVSCQDLKTTDCGQLFVCSNNCADFTACGKIFVHYEVEFYIPQTKTQLETALQPKCTAWFGAADNESTQLLGGGIISTLKIKVARNPLRIGLISPVGPTGYYERLRLPKGVYRVDYTINIVGDEDPAGVGKARYTGDILYGGISLGSQHSIYSKSNSWQSASYYPSVDNIVQISGFGLVEANGLDDMTITCQDSSTYIHAVLSRAIPSLMISPA